MLLETFLRHAKGKTVFTTFKRNAKRVATKKNTNKSPLTINGRNREYISLGASFLGRQKLQEVRCCK